MFKKLGITLIVAATFGLSLYNTVSLWTSSSGPHSLFPNAEQLQAAFARVAERAIPAVVIIKAGQKLNPRLDHDNPYEAILRQYFGVRELPKTPPPTLATGQGSGFIIRPDGHILTNYHIVHNNNNFKIILHDRREFDAQIVGVDPKTDLAVLKITATGPLPSLDFADSDQTKIGHWAIAIGAPFALEHTVTAGIISQKGRAVGLNVYENYLQTDAAVNPGNSGGPLLNLDGQVIGVNDFILTSPLTQGSIGLSFAIASNFARDISRQLIENREVVRPWLGLAMRPLPEARSGNLSQHPRKGVLISDVYLGNPAHLAGLQPGDIITEINNEQVNSSHDVQLAILKNKPGDIIKVVVNRNGSAQIFQVIAGRQNALTSDDGSQ